MQIIPALLEKSPTALFFQIKRLTPYFKIFQIDIADGIFVPNKTVQIDDIMKHETYNMKHLTFDFHLMVNDFEREIKKLEKLRNLLNIKNIFIHFSLSPNYSLLTTNYPLFSFCLVLNPEDKVEDLAKHYTLNPIPCIQIMSVNPGFQGSPFIPQTLKKIEQLRLKDYRNKIYLDGAINQDTIPSILSIKNKPDSLCVGSFLSKAKNLNERVDYLREIKD
ncbi:hypothetical protein A3C25_04260 [Candidatus Roizmanbacteria bacterium RIFCSPHIGHO2_02_FULL_38_11]|uniref:Ribulose-phosphate 3-epimerase n=1 Tax=Candidatus Roizmanbacteria bacterium RIFCSPHIGHO2_02_FULL_38_11 TaxID=1802039 RepID=A0A1F7H1D3_9BACT|nr:MAG: hypothetical protein A3C25_04260 [Candidatus Roizmanbacteria bacterium RIFCSPHIGHO2_02_FULL_38_11]